MRIQINDIGNHVLATINGNDYGAFSDGQEIIEIIYPRMTDCLFELNCRDVYAVVCVSIGLKTGTGVSMIIDKETKCINSIGSLIVDKDVGAKNAIAYADLQGPLFTFKNNKLSNICSYVAGEKHGFTCDLTKGKKVSFFDRGDKREIPYLDINSISSDDILQIALTSGMQIDNSYLIWQNYDY